MLNGLKFISISICFRIQVLTWTGCAVSLQKSMQRWSHRNFIASNRRLRERLGPRGDALEVIERRAEKPHLLAFSWAFFT